MYPPKKHVPEKTGFEKLMCDMIADILTTFPELENDNLHDDIVSVRNNDMDALNRLKEYCKKVYPERFFDILYENDDMFQEGSDKEVLFLPGIDFGPIWRNTSDANRIIIWKYIKLVLFSIVSEISDENSFGDTNKLFEAIGNDDLKSKLEETIKNMADMMSDPTNVESDNADDETEKEQDGNSKHPEFDAEKLHSHLEGLMGGKLGKLAKDIAEETAKDMGDQFTGNENPEDLFKHMLKDPGNIMKLVKSVGSKLDDRIKSGDISESELMSDAQDMMKKMKDIPGFGDINGLLSKMGINPSKVNMNAMSAHMEREMKKNATKERMRRKMNENPKSSTNNNDKPSPTPREESIDEMAEWIEGPNNERVFKVADGASRSNKSDNPKKKKKKKNK